MVFSSLFFVFVFLVVCMLAERFAKTVRAKNAVLLAFSLIFYAWSGPTLLLLLCGMTLVCYIGGLALSATYNKFVRKMHLLMTVAICLLLLGFFKYSTFLAVTLQGIFKFDSLIPEILLPIGISFYTFQLISYVADVYREQVPAQKNYATLLLYAGLFHQCVAGPIIRYSDVAAELRERTVTAEDLSRGILRFSTGLAKKAVLANRCGEVVSSLLTASALKTGSGGTVFLGGVFYMLQIYLDFSAYSDMAIGMGLVSGFHYPENFRYPYLADSVTDFWRRWHISLSSFFRDYVYIPLGGNRRGVGRQIRNLLIVWSLTGLWHGASWNYLLWGLYYFAFLVVEKFLLPKRDGQPTAVRVLRRVATLAVIYFGWLLFYFEDLGTLGKALGLLFSGEWGYYATTVLKGNLFFLPVAVLACTPFASWGWKKLQPLAQKRPNLQTAMQLAFDVTPAVLLVLSLVFLVGNTYNPFLYFRF